MGKQGTKYNGHGKIKSKVVQTEKHFSEYVILITTVNSHDSQQILVSQIFLLYKNQTLPLIFRDWGRKRRKSLN